jgi:hypothetical protein
MPKSKGIRGLGFLPRRPYGEMSKTDAHLLKEESANEDRAKRSGWAVVFGLGIEVVLAIIYRDHSSWIENWAPVAADALVTLGVFGEIHFAGVARRSGEEIRNRSNERVAAANERAAIAEKQAAEARERTAQLEQKIAGRSLSAEAFATLVDLFKSLNPKPLSPVIEFEGGDGETHLFAGEIQHALWQAGLAPVRMQERDTTGYTLFGVFVGDVPPGRGWKLMDGLIKAGIGSSLIESQNIPRWGGLIASADLYIWVGLKNPEMSKSHADRLFALAEK